MRAIHSKHLYELVISVLRGMRTSSGQTPAHGVDTIEQVAFTFKCIQYLPCS